VVIIYIDVLGIKLSYLVTGDGPVIILLHGWGANKTTFEKLAQELSNDYKVYSIDLPGFGQTNIEKPYTVFEVADIIHAAILKLGIKKPIIIGHSYGGRIGIIYSSRYDVDRLILISSAGVKERLSNKKKFKIKLYKALKKAGIKLNIGSKDYKNSDPIKRIMLINAVNTDLIDEMNKIKCNTLLLYGKNDTETPIRVANIINKNIKNSALISIDNCGHFPYIERFSYTLLIIKSFLSSE